MSKKDSSPSAKPAKPSPDFPLFPHAAGVWAKKIRGKLHYFGSWEDDRDGTRALAKYNEEKDDLHSGNKPRPDREGTTVKEVVNKFLNHKKQQVAAGELSSLTWTEYKTATDLLISALGKGRVVADLGPDDFAALRAKMSKRWGPVRVGNVVQYVRCVFRFAYDNDLIDKPVRYGQGFKKTSKKTLRLHRASQGAKLFTAAEIHKLLDAAGPQLRAMVLLGVNCGLGNTDCARLPLTAVNLDTGWLDYPRPKTGVGRRCPLWGETVTAIREALAKRPTPKNEADAGLVFVTKYGASWAGNATDHPISAAFARLLKAAGVNGRRGLGFYTLRHVFRTVSDGAKDPIAADALLGHEIAAMSTVHREAIDDDRLKAVVNHIHEWLFGAK